MGYLGIFIFIVFLLAYFRKRQTKHQNAVDEGFWSRENAANNIRRQDISELPYINIPLEKFPIGIWPDEDLKEQENVLTALSSKQILNLGNQTNTDLKLQYGPANLAILTDCEQNFTTLCRTLVTYADHLQKLGHQTEAQTVLEYGISCGSDISRNYLMLADLYIAQNQPAKIDELIEKASQLDSLMKTSIITHLEEKKNA